MGVDRVEKGAGVAVQGHAANLMHSTGTDPFFVSAHA